MDDVSEAAVLRAIDEMHARLGEQLTVDDLARAAMFSKFHFTRMFQRVTGVSPGRFLSALRLQRAKELLASTPMRVADISVSVGYNSVGTFSSRFSRSVGMSPTIYRRCAGYAMEIRDQADGLRPRLADAGLSCDVVLAEQDHDAMIFVGLFAGRIPEGRPARCAVLRASARVRFDNPPPGSWYLHAQSISVGDAPAVSKLGPSGASWGLYADRADRPVAVASAGPILLRPGTTASTKLILRPGRVLDPPVLLALLDVRTYALTGRAQSRNRAGSELASVA
ncbi:helix-turn-helix domain-containing protein [Plantactinospora soyae]